MENDKPLSINASLPLFKDYGQDKGGRNFVDGWSPEDWSSFGDYVREGFDQETFVDSSFNSAQEAFEFMSGVGEYRESNSFFYNNRDSAEFQQEGFFQSVKCPECLEKLTSQLEQDSIPRCDIVNPEIRPAKTEYQDTSFKLGEEKYVEKIWYKCGEHPEVSIMMTDTHYE